MKDKIFIDTNIWLYAFMEQDFKKTSIAREIIDKNMEQICLSTQILNEICINLLKKANYSEEEIKNLIKNFDEVYEIYPIRIEDCLKASEVRNKFNISYWDSLVIASALNNGCIILYSEDMQHNQIIENQLKIINPFLNNKE
ncbi:PIN domain-containing protein [Venenivibrio stagnispumantis]|uniref:Toxin-antitoxin system toxin component, PIN family n=1 Tax=Venenivibrio stagnispumantis TaxID=407998 RepID=A0AA46ADU4_9AQUI|nr:putative toxin-antitoxin system toxin component, PIN family [Venenivibrio stagnispumantis]MCW4572990.1 putative toxin-antitoxin system toxin component, PIN family [Venenivibrio stagnispumantis]SMP07922.1 putative toxin-antitoxin system toxin component, PIN family [Venenivibrio stagnispumantis]